MTGEASIWNPRTIIQVQSNTKSVEERLVATAGQTLFTLTTFAYEINTGALQIHKNGLLLAKGKDWAEQTDTTFSLVVPCSAGDVIIASGAVGIEGSVSYLDVDVYLDNYQAVRDYAGALTTVYAVGGVTRADGGQRFFGYVDGEAPGTYVDDDATVLVPTGGNGSAAWISNGVGGSGSATFSDVADMQAATGLAEGDVVATAGYNVAGDGGDNQYVLVAASTYAADGGFVIDLAGSNLQAVGAFPKGHYSVVHWGAQAGASVDASSAFQAAIDHVAFFGNGGTVHIPSRGSWLIANTIRLKSNVELTRDGAPPLSRDIGTGSKPTTLDGAVFIASSAMIKLDENTSISGITCISNSLTWPVSNTANFAGTALYINGFDGGSIAAHDVKITDVNILGFNQGIGCSTDNTERVWITDVKFDCLNGIFLKIVRDRSIVRNCNGWPFLTVTLATAGAKWRSGTAFNIEDSVDWCQVDNCFAYHYQVGFRAFNASTIMFNSCQTDSDSTDTVNTTTTGFSVAGDSWRVKILGCTAFARKYPYLVNTTATNKHPVQIENCSSWFNSGTGNAIITVLDGNVMVTGCQFSDWDYGIRRAGAAGYVFVDGCSFTGLENVFANEDPNPTLDAGWVIGDNMYFGNTRIGGSGNEHPNVIEVTAASTLSIPIFSRYMVLNGSGTVNIIDVNTCPTGVPFTFVFGATVTIAASGNIDLAGNVNKTFGAGDSLTLVYSGFHFTEISRTEI